MKSYNIGTIRFHGATIGRPPRQAIMGSHSIAILRFGNTICSTCIKRSEDGCIESTCANQYILKYIPMIDTCIIRAFVILFERCLQH